MTIVWGASEACCHLNRMPFLLEKKIGKPLSLRNYHFLSFGGISRKMPTIIWEVYENDSSFLKAYLHEAAFFISFNQDRLCNCLALSQTLKRFTKTWNRATHFVKILFCKSIIFHKNILFFLCIYFLIINKYIFLISNLVSTNRYNPCIKNEKLFGGIQ